MYTSVRLLNYRDFNALWAAGEVYKIMSNLGYDLVGECEAPLQWDFLFTEHSEPSLNELNRYFELLTDFKVEIETYDIEI